MLRFSVFSIALLFCYVFQVAAEQSGPTRAMLARKYTRAHSLGDSYLFSKRDGWNAVNVTNMLYKYRRDTNVDSRTSNNNTQQSRLSIRNRVMDKVLRVFSQFKGSGKSQAVTITWYTGNDLKNPSCWIDAVWSPTDEAFACALTQKGWTDHPKCFKFIELCNGPTKCVFTRVVDTCAGCPKGSKHVDLTRAAFSQLASLDEGVLTVQMRLANEPLTWFEELWGPKD